MTVATLFDHADPLAAAIDDLHAQTGVYTVDRIIDRILDLLGWPEAGQRVLDPGAGGGAFLVRAIARLKLAPDDIATLTDRVAGWEIHPAAVGAARQAIVEQLRSTGWSEFAARRAADIIVRHRDFLANPPAAGHYDIIAANPPYLRAASIPAAYRAVFEAVVAPYARADMLFAFIDRCADILSPGGRIGMVTADRWLFNDSSADLRERIGRQFTIGEIERHDATSVFYRPKSRRKGSPARVHPVMFTLTSDTSAGRTRLTRQPLVFGAAEETGPVLADMLGTEAIRIAPWLGPAGPFVIPAAEASHLPGHALVPCVDTDDIPSHEDRLGSPQRFALLTTRDRPDAAVLAHLEAQRHLIPSKSLKREAWWQPPETFAGRMPFAHDALLVPRIGKRLRPVRLPAGVLPINHNLTVIGGRSNASLDAIEAFLRSKEAHAYVEANAARLENGYYSITTKLLRRIPLSPAWQDFLQN